MGVSVLWRWRQRTNTKQQTKIPNKKIFIIARSHYRSNYNKTKDHIVWRFLFFFISYVTFLITFIKQRITNLLQLISLFLLHNRRSISNHTFHMGLQMQTKALNWRATDSFYYLWFTENLKLTVSDKKKPNKQTNRPSENITAKVYKTQQVSLFRLPLFAPGRFCDHFCWTSLTQTGRWKIEIWFSWEVKVMSHVRIFSLRQVFQRASDSHCSEPYSRAQIQGWYGCICAMKMASKNKHKTTNQNTK